MPRNLILVASPRAREGTNSSLSRLAREHSAILRKQILHTTKGTGHHLLTTGLYQRDRVVVHRAGTLGGLAELAAQVVRGHIAVAILLLDPADPWIDAVETRVLKRLCIQQRVRLITTYVAAARWLTLEADDSGDAAPTAVAPAAAVAVGSRNVNESGELIQLPIDRRTIALISHDRLKLEMVDFAQSKGALLALHERILTTGTTGTLLKLIFASPEAEGQLIQALREAKEDGRPAKILVEILKELERAPKDTGLAKLLEELRKTRPLVRCPEFADRIQTLASGPLGGDVLIAEAVLRNECHSVIFFQDPLEVHPHMDDMRLLEHTAQLPGVFAECVSDSVSAARWVEGLERETTTGAPPASTASLLRSAFRDHGLREAVVIPRDDDQDGVELGSHVAGAAAGYFHQRLCELLAHKRELRIGVAWGWGTRQALLALADWFAQGVVARPETVGKSIVWTPLIGIIGAEITDREGSVIAEGFRALYGGKVEAISCAGFAPKEAPLPDGVASVISSLENADLILTSAATWNQDTALIRDTGRSERYFPPFGDAAGLISGVFLRDTGEEVSHSYRIVGLGYNGFQRAAARGAVLLMCAGDARRPVLLAALRARMVSTLVTTEASARWLLASYNDA